MQIHANSTLFSVDLLFNQTSFQRRAMLFVTLSISGDVERLDNIVYDITHQAGMGPSNLLGYWNNSRYKLAGRKIIVVS